MTTLYENLQPTSRLENHKCSHVSRLAGQPEIVNGDNSRHLQLCLRPALLKIILLGNTGVGKSALFHTYADGVYPTEYTVSIGVDFRSKPVGDVKLQIWDTAGQEKYRAITKNYFRGTDVILLVYDISNRESFHSLSEWVETARQFVGNTMPRWIIVGNKADRWTRREVSQEEAAEFASSLGGTVWEVSAKMGIRVSDMFESLTVAPTPVPTPTTAPAAPTPVPIVLGVKPSRGFFSRLC